MDTITHGIAGALIGKAVFRGDEMCTRRPINRQRIVTWSLMLGAIFPDADVFRGWFSRNDMLIMTWHRSLTHSLFCLPIWALALALLSRGIAYWRKWEAPSLAALTAIYAVGIASHIFLDLVTDFGTMIWSPLKWTRPAWDLIFIIDFTLSAILFIPQILAWVYAKREGLRPRALSCWIISVAATIAVAAFGRVVGAPISLRYIFLTVVLLAAVFLLPSLRNFGLSLKSSTWNLAGLILAVAYIGAAYFVHNAAYARLQKFADAQHIEARGMAAFPLPPSMAHWDGLILAPRGVYETRINFGDLSGDADANRTLVSMTDLSSPATQQAPGTDQARAQQLPPIEYSYYPDAPSNSFIESAKHLRQVETFFWFARFPITRFHKEGTDSIVEFYDARFPHRDRGASPFTYQVRFDANGAVLYQGWKK
ncbi:MAG TPA: metal-dependent hydrolase [Candidatus Sulfotelmatobacter sp.]|nr:metal-dependent hydrolase [Candidatus Sulfotelmatobacter sp.]